MSARATPPFRADQVGSLIRPQALIDAREAAQAGKMSREQLLDIFRDTADYWGDRKIPFRCFYSFL